VAQALDGGALLDGAVKRLRELTGASLEQARDIVAGL
jgi:ribosomal protein L7/L12